MQNIFLAFYGLAIVLLDEFLPKSSHHLSIFLDLDYMCQVCIRCSEGEGNSASICAHIDSYIKKNICRCFDNGRVQIICPKAVFVVTL